MGELPHFTEHQDIKSSLISLHLNFLRDHLGPGFNKMSAEKQSAIEQSFYELFATLPSRRQDGIRQTLNGIASDIEEIPNFQQGIAFVKELAISARVIDVLDECGIVDSAVEGGIEALRKELSNDAPGVLAELEYYENDIKDTLRANRRRKGFRKTAELLLSIKSGIRQELDRLQLIPKETESTPITEEDYSPHYLLILSNLLLAGSIEYGLIGFSTLTKLIEEFYRVQRYSRIAGAWN